MDDGALLSEDAGRKVVALGPAGHRWLAELPDVVADLARAWGLTVGSPLGGGSAGFVAAARTEDGRPVVLKVAMPDGLEGNGEFGRELAAVRAGQGRGYVDLLQADPGRRAVVLERLGRPLSALDLAVDDRVDRIAATVAPSWAVAVPPDIRRTGAEQADFLAGFIASRWARLGQPCSAVVIEEATRCARSRRDAFAPDRAVLVHGDAHADNVLEDPAAPGRCKLIDPDPMRSEPAHDLGIAIREENDALLASPAPGDELQSWCARLDQATGAGEQAIWEWAYAERVSSGLFVLDLGIARGQDFLTVAEALLPP